MIKRPKAAIDGVLLVRHRGRHVDAVRDAMAVGQNQRRARIRFGLVERANGLRRIGAHRDLADVDVAVRDGHHSEVFLAACLAAGREFGHGAAERRLRRLAASVRVDAGVEHEDVDVATGRQHMIQAAVADVVRPAVAADDPDASA